MAIPLPTNIRPSCRVVHSPDTRRRVRGVGFALPGTNQPALSKTAVLSTACVLAGISGMAGLAHQMIWTRRLVDILGASPLTFSKVIGAFFLGLAVGSVLAALRSGVVRRPWRWVAGVELTVALLALPVLLTPQWAEMLHKSPQLAVWLKYLVPFLLVTPPAIAMGMVVPWMVRALSAHFPAAKRSATWPVWLYAANTLGGVAGIVAVFWFALPVIGLTGAGLAACGLNVLAAAVAMWLGRGVVNRHATEQTPSEHSDPFQHIARSSFVQSLLPPILAFSSGFLVLALEVVLQHQFAQVTINSLVSSGSVLAWALLSLAIGSALSPWLARWSDRSTRTRLILLGTAAACAVQPFLFTWMRDGVAILPYELKPAAYMWEVSKLALIALCPLFVVAGLGFPAVLQQAADNSASAPRSIAVLLAWNGLGGWLGSEVAQNVITPHFGLWQSVILVGMCYLLLTLLIPFKRPGTQVTWAVGAAMAAAFVLSGGLPQVTLNPGERVVALQVGREGVVATVDCGPGDRRMLFNNSYTLGGSRARANQERQAHLPILLHGQARTVAVLGVATGGTVAGASLHPNIERIDAAELSPLVLDQAQQCFGDLDRDLFRDRRVNLFSEDARWMIATRKAAYDVVVGDLFLPWRTGEGRLYSVEHFQAVRRALKPNGLICQWLPLFQLTRPQFDAIVRSFQQVFPDALIVRGDFYTELPILGLVGGRNLNQLDWTAIDQACAVLSERGQTTDPLVRHKEGVAMLLVGALPEPGRGPVNTLGNSWLEWDCGRNILGLQTPWFIGVPEAEYVRNVQRAAQTALPPELQTAHDTGQFLLTLEIAAKLELPVYQNLFSQLTARIPVTLREDANAEWREWPSRVKPHFNQ